MIKVSIRIFVPINFKKKIVIFIKNSLQKQVKVTFINNPKKIKNPKSKYDLGFFFKFISNEK